MQALRNASHLARSVLLWFALSIGAATASPLLAPQAMELICTGSGAMKLIVKTHDGAQELLSYSLHCPLCLVGGAPAPSVLPQTRARATSERQLGVVVRVPQSLPEAMPWFARAPPRPS